MLYGEYIDLRFCSKGDDDSWENITFFRRIFGNSQDDGRDEVEVGVKDWWARRGKKWEKFYYLFVCGSSMMTM